MDKKAKPHHRPIRQVPHARFRAAIDMDEMECARTTFRHPVERDHRKPTKVVFRAGREGRAQPRSGRATRIALRSAHPGQVMTNTRNASPIRRNGRDSVRRSPCTKSS
jgi:hypothetical protein